ncbi:endonuclease/exonuclease/phosphatase family protein [Rhizobium sp. CSW-27]|uniref:endonuclease/exonuclease/phosphatase family protein n=1 Tax=Rhizobium sp. CSW-27 TaxID=2839985 RepID=UPI001C01EE45|nr:endonuclease/exonuclease/phosphatase family protein [Rhizobium sp. CSW-27]MBT9371406.1 endonuclease/exonuclease/phosphatase family protein [Rhizobium sp. CSW-27]
MRLASYNVENLFDRAKVMMLDTWAEGSEVLQAFAEANEILGKPHYTEADRDKLAELLIELGLEKSDQASFVILRRNRGELLKRPRSGGLEITAEGRADWVGSLELTDAPVDHEAMLNTARVMDALKADVLGVVEAESRPTLLAFNEQILSHVGGTPFDHVMLIDGNDSRGIDVGILTRASYPLVSMVSHVDDAMDGERVFSRDCPDYTLATPSGERLHVLVNHFKSKGYGDPRRSDARRRQQAERVNAIVQALLDAGETHVAVIGDLNDTPDSDPLAPLIEGGLLTDAFLHPAFDDGGYPGTYGSCTASNKIDYLLLSQALFDKVRAGGVIRLGMWPGTRPKKWEVLPSLTARVNAASDHAALWVDLDLG